MNAKEMYDYRKARGLCYSCGAKAVDGRTRCARCAEINNLKQRMRYHDMTPAQKAEKRAYIKKWLKENPDKVEVYIGKRAEYNKRYREGYEW